MKKTIILLFGIILAFATCLPVETTAQRAITVASNVDIGDSLVYNLGADKEVYKWSSFYVEILGTALTVDDTTAKVEIYNTVNYDFTDATDLDVSSYLLLANSAGGTGTIMKSANFINNYLENVRIVIDPDEDDSGSGKVSIRIKPTYKSSYTAPD